MSKTTFGLIAAAGAATGAVCTAVFFSSRKPAPLPAQPPVPAGVAAGLARQKQERQPSKLVDPAGLFQYGMYRQGSSARFFHLHPAVVRKLVD